MDDAESFADSDHAEPGSQSRLSEGGQLLIWGVRHWMVAMLQGRSVPLSVLRSFETIGGARLYRAVTALVLLAARDADRPLVILPPCCRQLSADEESIARVLGALTRGSATVALASFRTLLGTEPSVALQRYAKGIAERFRSVGLKVALLEGEAGPHAVNG